MDLAHLPVLILLVSTLLVLFAVAPILLFAAAKMRKVRRWAAVHQISYPRADLISLVAVHREVFLRGEYDQILSELPAGATIIDVGGNIGLFVARANQLCTQAEIYSFEPMPAVFEHLERNCQTLAQSGSNRLQAKAMALGAEHADEVQMFWYPALSAISSSRALNTELIQAGLPGGLKILPKVMRPLGRLSFQAAAHLISSTSHLVQAKRRSLSFILEEQQIQQVDLLKIDVESDELNVLLGITDEHWERIHRVWVEVENHRAGPLDQILGILESRGFETQVPDADQNWAHVTARRFSLEIRVA